MGEVIMHLYATTVEPSGSITQVVAGSFLSGKSQDVAVVRGSETLCLFSQSTSTGLLTEIHRILAFAQIRRIEAFRPLGFPKDLLVLTSDSGNLTVIEFLPFEANPVSGEQAGERGPGFKVLCQETLCRTGCRRISVGTYIAKDPKGRAVILGAVEKNKLVFLTSKGSGESTLALSSPLEANVPNSITFDMVGLDVGFDNPSFAALEAEYGDPEDLGSGVATGEVRKTLVLYEVDLGLNQVIRRRAVPLDREAIGLLAVPQTEQTPSGVLVVLKSKVLLFNQKGEQTAEALFPNRIDNYKGKRIFQIISSCLYKLKAYFFFLLQNELGDLFKLTVETSAALSLSYLCTDKVSTGLALLKTGYLFKANENSDHEFFSVTKLEPNAEDAPLAREGLYIPRLIANSQLAKARSLKEGGLLGEETELFGGFEPLQTFRSLSGQVDSKFADLVGDGVGQHYVVTAGPNGSALHSLRVSMEVEELARSALPLKPRALFPVKRLAQADIQEFLPEQTDFLLLSIPGKTFVLNVNEKIEEVREDIGFNTSAETLHLMELTDRAGQACAWAQVTPDELRLVASGRQLGRSRFEGNQRARLASSHEGRLLIVSSTLNLLLYIQEGQGGQVQLEYQSRAELDIEVLCLTLFGGGHRGAGLMAALGLADSTIRVYSLDPRTSLTRLSLLTLQSPAESLVFAQGHLAVGTAGGVIGRASVDPLTGALGEVRLRTIGDGPIRLFRDAVVETTPEKGKGKGGLLICGPKVFFGREEEGVFELKLVNLNEESRISSLCRIAGKFGDRCFVFLTEGGLMKIVRARNPSPGLFPDKSLPLANSGRRLLLNHENLSIIVLESQCRVLSSENLGKKLAKLKGRLETRYPALVPLVASLSSSNPRELRFAPKATQWESRVSLIAAGSFKRLGNLELPGNNKHILTGLLTSFKDFETESFLMLSLCEDHDILANTFSGSCVSTYALEESGRKLVLLHITRLDLPAQALCGFRGRLLLGAGGFLRLYELGRKQLLKKNELKRRFNLINFIRSAGARVFVADAADSVHVVRFDEAEGQFRELADDILPRYTSALEVLDLATVIAADKFGNIFVLRLPQGAEEELTEDFVTYKLRWENSYLNGAPAKLEQLCAFYDVNVVTAIQKVVNPRNGFEYILTGNVEGKVMAWLPLETKSELDFFRHLELLMREERGSGEGITGREHLLFRGYYSAVKGVIDGDLCSQMLRLPPQKAAALAEGLERSQSEVAKRFEDLKFKLV